MEHEKAVLYENVFFPSVCWFYLDGIELKKSYFYCGRCVQLCDFMFGAPFFIYKKNFS